MKWIQLSRPAAGIAALAVLVLTMILAGVFVSETARLAGRSGGWQTQPGEPPAHQALDFEADGIRLPESYRADAVELSDDEPVIGVALGDEARAYRIAGLTDRRRHIVNDVLDGKPVSVTYCDLADCVRVFTGPGEGEPLPINLAGMLDARMILRIDGHDYFQDTTGPREPGPTVSFPFQDLPFQRTTWKAWKAAHPNTTITAVPTP